MSQNLVESGQRAAVREEDRVHGDGGAGYGAAHRRNGFGSNGGGARAETTVTDATRAGDATIAALEGLSQALEEMSRDQRLLQQRLKELQRQRSEGRAWRDILGDEEPPGTMQIVSRMLACLAKASGTLRKELVDTLRREGVSIPAIAKLFGVTHQRVSNLLRRPSD
jgi:hypothetical protein